MSVPTAPRTLPPRDPVTPPAPPHRPPADQSRWVVYSLLAGLCGFLFFYGLDAGELWRTESLRAIIAAEFLETGNWVVPTLYGNPLFTKPPGTYAAIALVSLPFGIVTEWTARLPSALAASACVLLVYWYFSRLLGRRAGLIAAALLPASLMWLDKATTAEIDMMQVAWVTASLLFFFRALEEEDKVTRWQGDKVTKNDVPVTLSPCHLVTLSPCPATPGRWWLAALLCVAAGLLTKWTAPAFFYGTAVPLLWRRGRLRLLWGRHHLLSAAVAAGVCLAWIGAAVAQAGWEAFYGTVSREAAMRLLPTHHHRPYPWDLVLLHPFKVLAAGLPMSAFALAALWPGFARLWDERGRRLLEALHCWVWPNLLFWSIVPEKAVRHSFPLFPGIAGLAAMVWLAWLTGRLPWRVPRVGPVAALAAVLVLWLGVKVAFVHAVVPQRNHGREPRAKGALLARLVPRGKTLFLFRLKDEGIMFYYGRRVRRLPDFARLPSSGGPHYCILDESEWRKWQARGATAIVHLRDEQGDPIVLVKVHR
jgi:4-amino-4-deoxy-L-arabinose transferase-like glycosyltransferase